MLEDPGPWVYTPFGQAIRFDRTNPFVPVLTVTFAKPGQWIWQIFGGEAHFAPTMESACDYVDMAWYLEHDVPNPHSDVPENYRFGLHVTRHTDWYGFDLLYPSWPSYGIWANALEPRQVTMTEEERETFLYWFTGGAV